MLLKLIDTGIVLVGFLIIAGCAISVSKPSLNPDSLDQPIRIYGRARQTYDHLLGQKAGTPEELAQLKKLIGIDQAITGSPLVAGNQVHLLIDGPIAFESMFEAMRNARHHIHVETFILQDDQIGRQFADIIRDRRMAGVAVRVLYDAVGVLGNDPNYFKRLQEYGVQLHKYNPIDPTENPEIWRINIRHHRKILVVDGRVAFTGGMNISSVYSSSSFYPSKRSSRLEDSWRDTHVRLEGPIVAVFQREFVDLWSRLRGEPPLSGMEYFPPLPDNGATLARVVVSTGGDTESKIYRLYSSVFAHARCRIWVTQGYFSPNPGFLEVLKSAARRGVDVRLLLPGLTDSWITVSSSRSNYAGLLKAGVRVFERKDALQHAKTAVVDGIWSTVGSTNLDYRSFFHSNEANVIIYGSEFGRRMEDLFLTDQDQNQEIRLPQWQNRNLGRRCMEFLGKLFAFWL